MKLIPICFGNEMVVRKLRKLVMCETELLRAMFPVVHAIDICARALRARRAS
jgi:hypothetical protein